MAKKAAKKKEKKPKKVIEKVEVEVVESGSENREELMSEAQRQLEEAKLKEEKWWLTEPWRSLLDEDLAETVDFSQFDLSKLIQEFTDKMIKEDLIDFRISGLALYSSARFYHQKITGVIKQEEKIVREEAKKRMQRAIPRSIGQPLRGAQKIATSDELFGAMRRAILETMQKRTKLKIRREKKEAKKTIVRTRRSKAKLPAEILKHITGSTETVEERLKKWHEKLKTMETLQDEEITLNQIKGMIYKNEKDDFGKKVKMIKAFEALLFLQSMSKIKMTQYDFDSPVEITIRDRKKIRSLADD